MCPSGRTNVSSPHLSSFPVILPPNPVGIQMFFKQRTQGLHQALYMRSDAHGERAQKVYALDYCAASFVTEGTSGSV